MFMSLPSNTKYEPTNHLADLHACRSTTQPPLPLDCTIGLRLMEWQHQPRLPRQPPPIPPTRSVTDTLAPKAFPVRQLAADANLHSTTKPSGTRLPTPAPPARGGRAPLVSPVEDLLSMHSRCFRRKKVSMSKHREVLEAVYEPALPLGH